MVVKLSAVKAFFLLVSLCFASAQECDSKTGVCDKHERCSAWQKEGECFRNRDYMAKQCPASCMKESASASITRSAAFENCKDQHDRCPVWARLGECSTNSRDMLRYCPKSCEMCGMEQEEYFDEGYDDDEEEEEEEEEEKAEEEKAEEEKACEDNDNRCSGWAKSGECAKNPNYMLVNCAFSCNVCQEKEASVAGGTEDDGTERSLKFGERQVAQGPDREKILHRIESTARYLQSDQVTRLPDHIRKECKNRHELCTFWQVIGECEKNQAYMATNCAAACHSCEMVDVEARCPKLPNAVPALVPGGLNKMFQRILEEAPGNRTLSEEDLQELEATKTPIYTVHVHSRPSDEPLTEVSVVQDKSLPPWVVTFENFVTPEECEAMIQLGYKYEYKRSEDVGARKFDGSFGSVQSSSRTSENAWCSDREGCRNETIPQRLHDRMSRVMSIPPENSEDLQLLKYEKGQFYKTHHDYIGHQRNRQCGPRILTFFLYLSDVEEGGGTNFPSLNLTVEPKRGRALLWPSILDSDPSAKDGRMNHQALPVIEGVKFAANGWIHLYDYLGPQTRGCN